MTPTGEFSHKVTVEPWPEEGVIVELTATAAEREALRARFDLVDLTSLSASVGIEKKTLELVLAGTIEATVAQTCVVTLKPVASALEVPFERRYRRRETHEKMLASGEVPDPDDEIDIDLLEDSEIDIGEAVAEELYLALDPYPRASDADRALQEMTTKTGVALDEATPNPFEKLRRH
ncbi:MAG: DUF177 domain-containing protein [Pseudomonadota bacterium]